VCVVLKLRKYYEVSLEVTLCIPLMGDCFCAVISAVCAAAVCVVWCVVSVLEYCVRIGIVMGEKIMCRESGM
jgi:hypothetical protein